MLKTLFSPAEGKHQGGSSNTQHQLFGAASSREEILTAYRSLVQSGDASAIKALFGMKKFEDCKPYICDIFDAPLMMAIERYSGVAYEYLAYAQQDGNTQRYLQENTLIFSNLYGPVLGSDTIPIYKVKQGNSIAGIAPDRYYKERFAYQLDLYLGEHDILDLRAGYYDKFYKPNKPFTTLKFLKNGKTVSHWAKAYRGIVLREIAKASLGSIEEFMSLELPNLRIHEIKK